MLASSFRRHGASRWMFVLALLLPYFASAQTAGLSDQAKAQIAALIAEKDARSPAERKIDSQLLYASRMARGAAIAPGVTSLETSVAFDADGLAVVEIRATPSPALLAAIAQAGGKVERSNAQLATVDASLPLAALVPLAERADVRFIVPRAEAMTQRAGSMWTTADARRAAAQQRAQAKGVESKEPEPLSPRLQRFKATVAEALAAHAAKIGTVTAQGDRTHRTDNVRASFGVTGAGLRIGILSDSFNNLGAAGADVVNGDLPGPGNPNGFTTPVTLVGSGDQPSGGSDEGRAMLQIVHDMAPGAQLYYATAFNSITDFANNIRALRGIATSAPPFGNLSPGADIIIDDIFYFVETGLHDGQLAASNRNMAVVSQAVNDVVANGALYFSSAGNSGNLTQSTSGAWEGDFVSGTLPVIIPGGGDAHVWSGTDVGNTITAVGGGPATMQWSDPIGASSNDYDLFRLDSTLATVIASSTNVQTGTQDPYEQVTVGGNTRLVIVRRTGAAARFISLSTNRGRLQYATNGQIRGHAGVAAAYAIAATPAAAAIGAAPNPTGPFPNPHVATNVTELFSSDGPRRVFYNADGTPITPGNLLAGTNGGLLRSKPDFTAADGVATTLPPGSGLNPFFGTSAAAPAAGSIFALLRQAAPTATPAQLRNFVASTALDIMAPGADSTSGGGIIQAFQAAQAAGATPIASLQLGTPAITGDNNRLDPNDCNQLTLPLRNIGAADATAVSAVLTTSTPGVTISQDAAAYSNIVASTGVENNTTPFQVSTDGSIANGTTANFTLTVSYTGGPSPAVLNFSLPVGANVNNYQFTATPTGATIPAGGTLVPGSSADDVVVTTTTPFALNLYGTAIAAGSTITLSTNGNIQFVPSGGSTSLTNVQLPAAVFPNATVLFAYWDDLVLTTPGGGIFVNTVGTAPNRQFVVEWRGRRFGDGATTQNINFAVILPEGADPAASPFRYVYVQTGIGIALNGLSATVGVQAGNTSTSRFTQYSLNQGVITAGLILDAALPAATPGAGACAAPNLAYVPPPPGPVSFTGVGIAGSNGTAGIIVTPSGGNGTGPGSTTTLGTCTFGGTNPGNFFLGSASFPLFFVGNTTTPQNLPLTCVAGATARTATLTCQEARGSAAPVARQWDLSCPAGTCPAITVNPTTLPNAVFGTPYSQTITQTGGAGTTSFTVTAGALPGGLLLSTGGVLSGTPTANGTFNFTVTATDANGCTGTRNYTLIVDAVAPTFAYNPATGSTVSATGGTTIGTTGTLTITPSVATPGAGTGAAATTSLTCTAPTAPFAGFGQTVSAIGAGAISGGPLTGSCTLGATAATQALNCQETRGTAAPVARTWTLSCPAGTCPVITVNPTTLPNATAGAVYNQTITQTGGIGTTSFTVTGGALPGGLLLSTGGVLSGTPTANGTFNFTVTATDANGCTGTRNYTLIVDAAAPTFAYNPATGATVSATGGTTIGTTGALTITPSVATPGAGTGAGATTSLTCTAPTAPFAGFGQTVSAIGAGAISGGPLTGSCTLGATAATQALNCQETRGTAAPVTRTWTLSCPAGTCPVITVNPTTLPNATAGAVYNQTITQTGGIGTTAFTVTGGALPGGLLLSTGGVLSGTPTANGTFNFTVTATDANSCTGTRAYTLVVDAVAPTFAYNPATGSTVSATGGTTIGTTGTLTITPSVATPGAGTGAGATTTLTCTAPTAPFTGFGQTVSAIGTGAISGGPLTGTCTLGATAATQALNCQETRGTAAPVTRTWTLSCPAGSLLPLTSTPAAGSNVTLNGAFGAPAPTTTISFANPNPIAISLTCTAPTGGYAATSPLVINLPANGSGSITIALPLGAGSYTGSFSCQPAGSTQTLNYTLNGTIAAAQPIDATSAWSRLLLMLSVLVFGMFAIAAARRP